MLLKVWFKQPEIQRFKRGLHGATLDEAAIIGYVHDGGFDTWLKRINRWISDEAAQPSAMDEAWSHTEQLVLSASVPTQPVAQATSQHSRVSSNVCSEIRLRHMWVDMSASEAKAPQVGPRRRS